MVPTQNFVYPNINKTIGLQISYLYCDVIKYFFFYLAKVTPQGQLSHPSLRYDLIHYDFKMTANNIATIGLQTI